jgi:predicted nucleic acid-binding protein
MRTVVLDTNVLLRLVHAEAPEHELCQGAVRTLLGRGSALAIVLQVAVEFWVVATRPANVNGLGWSANIAREKLDQILTGVMVLTEPNEILTNWLEMVTSVPVLGKRAHDARLAATMRTNGVGHLLTLNAGDFAGFPGIVAIHPSAADAV